jgi:hypothetical protein
MRTYIMALGADVWDVVDTGYVKPVVLANKDDKLEFSFNAKAMNAILSGCRSIIRKSYAPRNCQRNVGQTH